MRIRRSIIWFCVVIVALTALIIWFGKKKPTEISTLALVETNVVAPMVTSSGLPGINSSRTNPPPIIKPMVTNEQGSATESNANREIGILSADNDQPIVFYGKIEDQFGNAVSGAAVSFEVRIMNGHESTVKRGSAVSDGDGKFTISGYHGESLGMGAMKTGYVSISASGSGIYSKLWPEDQRAHPDPSNPAIIRMWKLAGAQPLISFSFKTYMPVDGTPVLLDFQTSQLVQTGGDVAIRLQSPPEPSVRNGYDWQAVVQMQNGGIMQSGGLGLQKMFQAPDSGYTSEFNLSFKNDKRPWTPRFNDDFYFTIQGGKCYGKLWIEFDTDVVKNGAAFVTLKGYLNPAGSRNLEIDPSMVTDGHP